MGAQLQTIASVLSRLAAEQASAARVAAVVAERMHAVQLALGPIIGDRGVAALYRRSLFLIHRDAVWTDSFFVESTPRHNYATLESNLAQLSAADALAVAESLFANLHTILVSLIGASLTERLLHPMFDTLSSGAAVQGNPHEQ